MATTIISMFDEQTANLLKNVRVIDKSLNQYRSEEDQDNTRIKEKGLVPSIKVGMSCSVCEIMEFDSIKAQREHFKLDWHRFNVKQKLMNRTAITEEDFEETISGEVSSISGSDTSDSEDSSDQDLEMERTTPQILPESFPTEDEEDNTKRGRSHPKLFLVSDDGCVFSVYRMTVFSPKSIPEKELDLIKEIQKIQEEYFWMIIMTAGGHFAAAVFDGKNVVVHKTFHRYTVRAKRGTAQGIRDNQQGVQTRSAGASLRRHNEAALAQEVQELLQSWSEYLKKCHKIFIRIPTYNKPMFFGGKNSPLNKNDPRIRTIPFSTRRPTFKEVKRVQEELSKVQILGQESEVLDKLLIQLSPKKLHPNPDKINHRANKTNLSSTIKSDSSEVIDELQTEPLRDEIDDVSEDFTRVAGISVKKGKKKKKNSHYGQEKVSSAARCQDREVVLPDHHLWNRFYCAVVSGNTEVVAQLLPSLQNQTSVKPITCEEITPSEPEQGKPSDTLMTEMVDTNSQKTTVPTDQCHASNDSTVGCTDSTITDACKLLNECWGEGGGSLLHAASKASQTEIIYTLLLNGADPSIRDKSGKTPYDSAKSKEARDQFRQFMADYPSAFDYSKSHIPSPLTQEMKEEKERKESEKKKAQRKAKKLRAKEQKANEQKKQEENAERKKKEMMSDREKRAQAAEKRFAKQLEKNSNLSCAMCSQDLKGRVPFERLTYKYCTTECVRQHRLILENKGR